MRTEIKEKALDAFSESSWQEIFSTLTQISGNLLEAVQYMKMQDAALTMVSRNLDRSLVLKARLEAGEGAPESLQQEYEILHAHIAGLNNNRFKEQPLFGEAGGSAIRVYSFENGKWITLVMDQPDLTTEVFSFLRGGQLIENAITYTVTAEDIMEAQQVALNYRLINGAQTERIEKSLQQIRITMTQLTQLVPQSGAGDTGANVVSIHDTVEKSERILEVAQQFASGISSQKLATA